MNVKLLTSQNSMKDMENFAALAALTCHANTEKDYVPSEVLKRIIGYGHESRHISLSVESTRHTLRKILTDNSEFEKICHGVNSEWLSVLNNLRGIAMRFPDLPNDKLKYFLPEFWPTNLFLTLNVRELRHILELRTSPRALKEFRTLAHELFNAVPDDFKYLLADCVHEEAE